MTGQASSSATSDKETASHGTEPKRFMRWHRRVLGLCLVIFALELGLFLVVFPWRPEWELGWVPVHVPKFFKVWMSHYLRGAVSGLGFLNIYIALAELFRQLKSLFNEPKA